MFARFQDYATSLKPSLDSAFTGHLTRLLGNGEPLRPIGEIQLLTGGKKIRGALLCLVAAALGGALEDALPRAVAIELIHTASLIHDDFVDQHRTRRNTAAAWTLEGARRAVLLGDILFASAIRMMSEMGRIDGLIVSGAIAEIARGAWHEPLDSTSLARELETDRDYAALYEKIIYLKTGVLFGAACQLGAVAAGTDERRRRVWGDYGLRIGEAYQIADDLHEIDQCLVTGTVSGSGMAALAPALLYFAAGSRQSVVKALRRKSSDLNGELLSHFMAAAELMKEEKEKRLRSAVEVIESDPVENDFHRLACGTPWDIIRMFDEREHSASSP